MHALWLAIKGIALFLASLGAGLLAGAYFSALTLAALALLLAVPISVGYLIKKLSDKVGSTTLFALGLPLMLLGGYLLHSANISATIGLALSTNPVLTLIGLGIVYSAAFVGLTLGTTVLAIHAGFKLSDWLQGINRDDYSSTPLPPSSHADMRRGMPDKESKRVPESVAPYVPLDVPLASSPTARSDTAAKAPTEHHRPRRYSR